MTLHWIYEAAEEHRGQVADVSGNPLTHSAASELNRPRIRWRRPGDIPAMPPHFATFRRTPRELFARHGVTLWHVTVAANLSSIVHQGAILSDALQGHEGLEPLRVFGWGDIFAGSPSRAFVSLAIADRAALQELVLLEPRPPTIALIKVTPSVLDADGVRFFPGWPDESDLGDEGAPGLTGNRGAAWLFAPSGRPWVGASVFVPDYVDLTEIEEVNLIDPAPEDGAVHQLAWPTGCLVQTADLRRWGVTPRPAAQ